MSRHVTFCPSCALKPTHSHLESLLTLSTSSPILFIHRSTRSLFSLVSFSEFASAMFSCSPSATISSCASTTSLLLPLASSSLSFSLLSTANFCCVSCAIWDDETLFWSSRVLREVVSSSTWDCRAVRAFCVVARSARKRASRSEGLDSGSFAKAVFPLFGVLKRSLLSVEGCGDGGGAVPCLASRDAVRSASLESIFQLESLVDISVANTRTGIDVWFMCLLAGITFVQSSGVLLDPVAHGVVLLTLRTPEGVSSVRRYPVGIMKSCRRRRRMTAKKAGRRSCREVNGLWHNRPMTSAQPGFGSTSLVLVSP